MKKDCSPCGALATALASFSHHSWQKNICELFDNSFDAGALEATCEWGRRHADDSHEYFRVSDDGTGVRDLLTVFRLGDHTEHDATMSGKFGSGGTIVHLWACECTGVSHIRSVWNGEAREGSYDWALTESSGKWELDETDHPPPPAEGERGTVLTIKPCTRRAPDGGAKFAALLRVLGYVYRPALLGTPKRSLRLRRHPNEGWSYVEPWQLPELEPTGQVKKELRLGRRTVRVHAGIVKDQNQNTRPGIAIECGFRMLGESVAIGCEEYSVANIAGIVTLAGTSKDWPVTTNKDELAAGSVYDELDEALFEVLEPLLVAAQNKAMTLHVAQLTEQLSLLVNGAKVNARARRRGRGQQEGTVNPTGDGAGHTQAEEEQDGETFPSRGGRGTTYVVDWKAFEESDERASEFSGKNRIFLNTRHPWIIRQRDANNIEALHCEIAHAIASGDQRLRSGQLAMTYGGEHAKAGHVLSRRVLGLK